MLKHHGWLALLLFLPTACGSDILVTKQDDSILPFSSAATISPPTGVLTGMTLICSATATDSNGDVVTPSFEWTVGEVSVQTGDSYTVTASDTDVGDRIDCTATAVTSDDQTVTSSTSVLLENTGPVLGEVAILPDTEVVNDSVLTCTGSVTDPDEDGLSPSYAWVMSEMEVGTGAELDLYTTEAQPLDSVECQVSVIDSHGGSDSGVAVVSIDNRLPTDPEVEIRPTSPKASVDDLVCSASGSTDADGQDVSYSYSWVSDLGASQDGDIVLSSATMAEEEWTCTAVASDGIGEASASASVVVADTDCGDTLTDFDGNSYSSVEIGTQCWMASNLNATHDASGTSIDRWCCGDCSQYGGMYDWSTVMNGSTAEGTQGICPNGWHVPSDADWFALESYVDSSLSDPGYIGWNTTTIGDDLSTSGTYGFDWTTGGYGSGGNGCIYDYDRILYWTSTSYSSTEAVSRLFNTAYAGSNRDLRLKAFGFYVRCLKD